jgi:hypothetical protein
MDYISVSETTELGLKVRRSLMEKKAPQVAFTVDKHGRPLAYFWGGSCRGIPQPRWFRMGYDEAKLAVATGAARETTYRPMGL